MEGPSPKKRRKSIGRRVSFAPDAQLETMHLFIKEEYRRTPEGRPTRASPVQERTDEFSPGLQPYDPNIWGPPATLDPLSPTTDLISAAGSPGSTMDITNKTAGAPPFSFPQAEEESPNVLPRIMGDITAGLPSIAQLAADMATDEINWEQPAKHQSGNITQGVPALSTLLEEDEQNTSRELGDENMSVNMELTSNEGTRQFTKQQRPGPSQDAILPSPQHSTGSVMMDITDTATAAARTATDDLTLAGYTRAIEQGRHPTWGPQQTSQLDSATPVKQQAGTPLAAQSRPRTGLANMQAAEPGSAAKRAQQPQGQRSKWGFVPGEDDTLDLNMERAGHALMGDTTYNHIYYDTGSTGTVTQSLRHHVKAKQDPEDAFKPYQANLQPVASASQQPLPTQASQGQRWSYSPSEQPLPNQDQTQQPLGGQASQARGRTPSPAEVPLPVQATAEAGAAAGVYPQDAPAAAMQSPGLAPAADTPTGLRRVSSARDLTGHLLEDGPAGMASQAAADDMQQDVALAEVQPLQQSPTLGLVFPKLTGRGDMTTGLLLEPEPSPEVPGPLGALRRQLKQLQAPQSDREGFGRSDSTGPNTLKLLQPTGTNTHLLGGAARPAQHRISVGMTGALLSNGTTNLLADRTMASAIGNASRRALSHGHTATLGLDDSNEVMDLLADNTMEGLEAPPELPGGPSNAGGQPQVAATPQLPVQPSTATLYSQPRSVFPGGALLARTPPTGQRDPSQRPPARQGPSAGHTNRRLVMGDPTSPQPTPVPLQSSPQPSPVPSRQCNPSQGFIGQSPAHANPIAAAQLDSGAAAEEEEKPMLGALGGAKLARTPIGRAAGDQVLGGSRLARTPIGKAPGLAHPSPGNTRLGYPAGTSSALRSSMNPSQLNSPAPSRHGAGQLARTPRAQPLAARSPYQPALGGADVLGGPRLARTPVGKPPLAGQRGPPTSAERMPGGFKLARTPMAAALTPIGGSPLHPSSPALQATALPITFQDFLKEVDIRFMDQLRRGASVVAADLARDPPPASLKEAYHLVCLTVPEVGQLEASIATLKEEIETRKAAVANKEALLANHNPPIFQAVQLANVTELAEMKRRAGLLKRVCRQRTQGAWKEWRTSMEAQRAEWLSAHLNLLQQDRACLDQGQQGVQQVQLEAQELGNSLRADRNALKARCQESKQQQKELAQMQASLRTIQAANQERLHRQQAAQNQLTHLRVEQQGQREEREVLLARLASLGSSSQQDSSPESRARKAASHQASAQVVLQQVAMLDALKACVGWQCEGSGQQLTLRCGPLFCVKLQVPSQADSHIQGSIQLTPTDAAKHTARWHPLAAELAGITGDAGAASNQIHVPGNSAAQLAAVVQDTTCRLSRISDLITELTDLRLMVPAVSSVQAEGNAVQLVFLGVEAELKFSIELKIGQEYPAGELECTARIQLQQGNSLTEAAIQKVAAEVPAGVGRLTSVCRDLSLLTAPHKPSATEQSEQELQVFCNPLFGA